jgi:hypothetical protein
LTVEDQAGDRVRERLRNLGTVNISDRRGLH